MTARPPPASPTELFAPEQWQRIDSLLRQFDSAQSLWLSGYLAASASGKQGEVALPASGAPALTIAYGSETGNCEQLARNLHQQVLELGHSVQLTDLATLKVRQLRKLDTLWLIVSTHGDGDPPITAADFHRDLFAADHLKLGSLHYAVLALGDSTYEHFCQTGIDFDARLAALGARRLAERVDCDVDFETPARQWCEQRLAALPTADRATAPAAVAQDPRADSSSLYSKQRPLRSEVLEQLALSAADRPLGNYHLSLAIEEGSLPLQPGDAVGVFAHNPHTLVAAVLDLARLQGEAGVSIDGRAMSLATALGSARDLAIPTRKLLQSWAAWSGDTDLVTLGEDSKQARSWLKQRHLLDVLRTAPARVPSAQALVDVLRPLQPRLYDVANHVSADSDELELLVKRFNYPLGDREYAGIASHYLCDLAVGDSVRIYPHRNARFALPQVENPVILVGYGTGVAPYRAYLQARAARGDRNPCWLVLGEKSYEEDFLYQLEWQGWLASGLLSHLDPVFADDEPRRSLVSAFLDKADRLQRWIDDGALVYLCGDKAVLERCEEQMQEALRIASGCSRDECATLWQSLVDEQRVRRNLY